MVSSRDSARTTTLVGRLSRLGFVDIERAQMFLTDDALVALIGPVPPRSALLTDLGRVADPDLALLALVRLVESAQGTAAEATLADMLRGLGTPSGAIGADEETDSAQERARTRLFAVLGASSALGDEIIRHPAILTVVTDEQDPFEVSARDVRTELLVAAGADSEAPAPVASGDTPVDALRHAYRTRILRIAAADLSHPDPLALLPRVGTALADLAAAALEGALAVARSELEDNGEGVRIAVIGMGKTGGGELNYVSDVDVVYVVEPREGYDEDYATSVGARLAAGLAQACAAPSSEPALWAVDAALRPEGKQGPLVRTLASHVAYYDRWAKTWEFQALLKARPVAGDRELGNAYVAALNPLVWQAVERENFVSDTQAMRRRVEEHVPPAEADRQIKLGRGGLRDVEFTVQLLQLVHGRADESIRGRGTLDALSALSAAGYVGRAHAAQLATCYRFLRSLEHRVQVYRMRRTHLMPSREADLRRLARSLGMSTDGRGGLAERWRDTRRQVRSLHEELYYRPLLPETAQLSTEEARLAPTAARARLAAIGYRDPNGAMRHIQALTEGVSRRAAIQRQLLPVLLGWFAEGADPDRGLLAFRKLSDTLGTTPWYLKLLRDSGFAARRLATVLANSQYLADALARSPESVKWLDGGDGLEAHDAARVGKEVDAILTRADQIEPATTALRAVRRRELTRTGVAEILGLRDNPSSQESISDAADLVLVGALRVAAYTAGVDLGHGTDPAAAPARMLVVGMGRLGGREMGYGSDADVLFVYEPRPGATDAAAKKYAVRAATLLRAICSELGPEPALAVDADLRPEGRSGPLVRSFDSYAEYYARWSQTWESQALLRARPVAGDADLGERFVALVDPLRYPADGIAPGDVREIRRIKARIESERLPRGVEPTRHLKLGRGGISDVEWTVQLLQLTHASRVEGLRTTQTLRALRAAEAEELIDPVDADSLAEAWLLASRLRAANVLWSGRSSGQTVNILPSDSQALSGLAQVLRFDGTGGELEDLYLRTARRARSVVDRVFYGED